MIGKSKVQWSLMSIINIQELVNVNYCSFFSSKMLQPVENDNKCTVPGEH